MKKITLIMLLIVILYGVQMTVLTSSILYFCASTALSALLISILKLVKIHEAYKEGS